MGQWWFESCLWLVSWLVESWWPSQSVLLLKVIYFLIPIDRSGSCPQAFTHVLTVRKGSRVLIQPSQRCQSLTGCSHCLLQSPFFLPFCSSFSSFFPLLLIKAKRNSPWVLFIDEWSLWLIYNTLISTYGAFVMVNKRLKNGRAENIVRLHAFNYITETHLLCTETLKSLVLSSSVSPSLFRRLAHLSLH